MKKLLSLLVTTGLTFCSSNISSQEFKEPQGIEKEYPGLQLPRETEKNKFIPAGALAAGPIQVNTMYYGVRTAMWYNKDCHSQEDYRKKLIERGGDIPRDELFLDLEPIDDILDLSLEKLDKLIEDYQQSLELAKTFL